MKFIQLFSTITSLAIFATAPGVSAAGLRGPLEALEHVPPFDLPWEKKLPDSDSVLVSVSGVTSQEKDPMQKAINLANDARPSSERRSLYVKHELVGPLVGAINTPGTGGTEGPGGYAGGYNDNDGSYGYDNYGDSYDYDYDNGSESNYYNRKYNHGYNGGGNYDYQRHGY